MRTWKKWWALIEDVLAGSFLVTGLCLILYGVMMRYVFNSPKSWVEEITNYTIIWGALFGVSIALRDGHHIQVDMLYDRLPKKVQRWVRVFSDLMGVLFCLFYTYYGYVLVDKRLESGMISLDVGIPMWLVYLILPISGIMFLMRFLERLVNSLRGKEEEKHDPAAV